LLSRLGLSRLRRKKQDTDPTLQGKERAGVRRRMGYGVEGSGQTDGLWDGGVKERGDML